MHLFAQFTLWTLLMSMAWGQNDPLEQPTHPASVPSLFELSRHTFFEKLEQGKPRRLLTRKDPDYVYLRHLVEKGLHARVTIPQVGVCGLGGRNVHCLGEHVMKLNHLSFDVPSQSLHWVGDRVVMLLRPGEMGFGDLTMGFVWRYPAPPFPLTMFDLTTSKVDFTYFFCGMGPLDPRILCLTFTMYDAQGLRRGQPRAAPWFAIGPMSPGTPIASNRPDMVCLERREDHAWKLYLRPKHSWRYYELSRPGPEADLVLEKIEFSPDPTSYALTLVLTRAGRRQPPRHVLDYRTDGVW